MGPSRFCDNVPVSPLILDIGLSQNRLGTSNVTFIK